MQDSAEQADLRRKIAAWMQTTGPDVIREVIADEFKAELESMGGEELSYIARYGFMGVFQMESEWLVRHIAEDIAEGTDDLVSGWEEYREGFEAELVKPTQGGDTECQ